MGRGRSGPGRGDARAQQRPLGGPGRPRPCWWGGRGGGGGAEPRLRVKIAAAAMRKVSPGGGGGRGRILPLVVRGRGRDLGGLAAPTGAASPVPTAAPGGRRPWRRCPRSLAAVPQFPRPGCPGCPGPVPGPPAGDGHVFGCRAGGSKAGAGSRARREPHGRSQSMNKCITPRPVPAVPAVPPGAGRGRCSRPVTSRSPSASMAPEEPPAPAAARGSAGSHPALAWPRCSVPAPQAALCCPVYGPQCHCIVPKAGTLSPVPVAWSPVPVDGPQCWCTVPTPRERSPSPPQASPSVSVARQRRAGRQTDRRVSGAGGAWPNEYRWAVAAGRSAGQVCAPAGALGRPGLGQNCP